MKNSNFPLRPEEFRTVAEKAVQGYLHTQFPTFFSAEERQDLVSDVVLRMWRASDSYDNTKGALFTWVGTIARNVVRSAALSKWNRSHISETFDDDFALDESVYGLYRSGEFSADGALLADELMDGFLSVLGEGRDARFLGWQVAGLSAAEIAKREGVSVESVHTALCRMRRKLRESALAA
jgi:RNA polymerase sigma factor (sigma-70 family)